MISALSEKQCPHFWISEINLFKDFAPDDFEVSLSVLRKFQRNQVPYLLGRVFQMGECFCCGFVDEFEDLITSQNNQNRCNDHMVVMVIDDDMSSNHDEAHLLKI